MVRPKVLVSLSYNNPDLAESYLRRLEREEGYLTLNVEQLCEEEVQRGTSLGNQMSAFTQSGQTVPARMLVELLRKALFYNPLNNKFVLTTFPEKKPEFEAFERALFPIDGLLNFMKAGQQVSYSAKLNPALHYIALAKQLLVSNEDTGAFRAYMTKRTKWGLVVGPSASGKTTLARYIAQRYGYTLVEWEPTIAALKEKLGQPGEPLEDVPLPRIVDYYTRTFAPVLRDKFVFDGFPPGCDTKAQQELFLGIGQPAWLLSTQIGKDQLWKRFKLKNEMDAAAELTPEDDEKITGFLTAAEAVHALLSACTRTHHIT